MASKVVVSVAKERRAVRGEGCEGLLPETATGQVQVQASGEGHRGRVPAVCLCLVYNVL